MLAGTVGKRCWNKVVRAAVFLFLLSSCGTFVPEPASPEIVPFSGPDAPPGPYRLRPGDRLQVTIFGEPALSGEISVDALGQAPVPLAGKLPLVDLTTDEAEQRINEALSPEYLRAPQVRLEVLSHQPFYILGEVQRPGAYPYFAGLTVLEAVALAGGFTYRAREAPIIILRRTADGAVQLEGDGMTLLRPGDMLRIRARYF